MSVGGYETLDRDEFESLRPRLHGIAYRMTGSVADADDVLQDAWLRWRRVATATVANSEAYLVRIVTRLALDRLRASHRRKEEYIGPYLPEPLIGEIVGESDPAEATELADSLTFAFLVMLDELTPVERAVLLLHDVFGYSFNEVAAATDRSPSACRQVASRTRRRLQEHRGRTVRRDAAQQEHMLEAFANATITGDIPGLMALLAPDVVQLDDGGPRRRASRRPIIGPHRVARLNVNLAKRLFATPGLTGDIAEINGALGVVIRVDGRTELTMSFAYGPDGRIHRIYMQVNPDKLRHVP